jgi:hypothetical protein
VATVLWKRLGEADYVTDSGEQEQFLVGVIEEALVGYEEGRSDLGGLVRRVESAIDDLAIGLLSCVDRGASLRSSTRSCSIRDVQTLMMRSSVMSRVTLWRCVR